MPYARSDVMSVIISRAHGGCGQPHSRPVRNGAPIKTWEETCPKCASHLLHDPLWSGTLADVPSTPDEDLARDNAEKSTARSREDIMALALAKIAGLPVAEFLGGMLGQAADNGTTYCAAGHENFPSAKFCAECGEQLGPGLKQLPASADDALPLAGARTEQAMASDLGLRGGMTAQPAGKPARQPRQPRQARQPRVIKTVPAPADAGQV